jgi:hypothetical protein
MSPALRNLSRADTGRPNPEEESTVGEAWDQELVFARLSWGARPESAEQVARRLRETLALLQDLVPGQPDPLSYPDDLDDAERWSRFVAEHVVRADNGQAEPESGFAPTVEIPAADRSPAISVLPSAGGRIQSGPMFNNSVMIRFGTQTGPSPALPASRNVQPVAVDLIRGLVSIWQPDVAVLTGRSGNKAQLRLGPKRGATIGAVTWLSGRVFPVPDGVEGATVLPYGEGTLLVVGSPEAPSLDAEATLAVRSRLPEAVTQAAAPPVQEVAPALPAVEVLAADEEPADKAPAAAAAASGDPEEVLARLRAVSVPLPEDLAGLAEQSGWPEVIADLRDSFDRLVSEPPFVNQLPELAQRVPRVTDELLVELLREVSTPLLDATAGRYLQLYRGLLALEQEDWPSALDLVSPFASAAEADLREVKQRVDGTVGRLVEHEVAGRFQP